MEVKRKQEEEERKRREEEERRIQVGCCRSLFVSTRRLFAQDGE